MEVLLINPVERDFMPPSVFPLGLAYIAAALEEAGHVPFVLDINTQREGWEGALETLLQERSWGWVGISSIITQYTQVKLIGAMVKRVQPESVLVHGGPGPTSLPSIFLEKAHGDVVVVGEGEEVVVEMTRALADGGALSACKGLALPDPFHAFSPSTPIHDLDMLPNPAWGMLKTDVYAQNNLYTPGGLGPGLNVITSRGCPGLCTYCMRNFGNKVRFRSVEDILDEVRELKSAHGVRHIHFVDDTLATDRDRLSALCTAIVDERVTWSANARVNQVRPEILAEMAEAGCQYISYGIESADARILKEMRKGITAEQAARAIQWTREAGIQPRGYFMIGFPSETAETIRSSVEFCKENLVGGEFFFLTPFPGTEVWDDAISRGLIKDFDTYLEVAGEVRNFVVNLTHALDNDSLFRLKEEAENEIRDHLRANGIEVRESHREDPWESVKSLPKFA